MPIQKTCESCSVSFKVPPCRAVQKFCSIKCYDKTGNKNPKWRGGFLVSDGYRYIYQPSHPNATKMGYVLEHRLAFEKKLGRPLIKGEAIHHIDGDKLNNSIENLHVCSSNGSHFIDHHLQSRNKSGRFETTK